jgi:hypothetical protein
MRFLFNFTGGNQASGGVNVWMAHQGKEVIIDVGVIGSGKDGKRFRFFPDGTYKVEG